MNLTYVIEKFLYEHDGNNRYVFGTFGDRPLICLGLNPSDANPKYSDSTFRNVSKIAFLYSYDSVIMLNIFLSLLTTGISEIDSKILDKNLKTIEKVISAFEKKNNEVDILCAWGSGVKRKNFSEYFKKLWEILDKYNIKYFKIAGDEKHPRKPNRIKIEKVLTEFVLQTYLNDNFYLGNKN